MSRDQLRTTSDSSVGATDQDYIPVTGTTLVSKRLLDVKIQADANEAQRQTDREAAQAQQILHALLDGTLSISAYDEFALAVSASIYTYTLSYEGIRVYTIIITDPLGDYSTAATKIDNIFLEDAGAILYEDSGELLAEG
jgi:predicted choloylglycine hydrolase